MFTSPSYFFLAYSYFLELVLVTLFAKNRDKILYTAIHLKTPIA